MATKEMFDEEKTREGTYTNVTTLNVTLQDTDLNQYVIKIKEPMSGGVTRDQVVAAFSHIIGQGASGKRILYSRAGMPFQAVGSIQIVNVVTTKQDVVQPYVGAEIVTYIPCAGTNKKIVAYNDAVEKFKFECRYMSFLDVDEFIFPRKNQSIVEVIDEILSDKENVGGIEFNRYTYTAGRNVSVDAKGVLKNERGNPRLRITSSSA